MSDVAPPQPGWYADPENPAGERWWNGSAWSEHKRDSTDPPSDPYATPEPANGQVTPAPYYAAPAPGAGTNGLAVAGLITSAVAWLLIPLLGPIVGIILSALGLRAAKQREAVGNPNSGRGVALAGLIVGIVIAGISLLVVVAYVALFTSLATSSSYYG